MSDESRCIYCNGRVVKAFANGSWEPAAAVDGCTCPMVKKTGVNDTEVHWAKRKQSILAICSDSRPHTVESHIVPLMTSPVAEATPVTCLACIAIHG